MQVGRYVRAGTTFVNAEILVLGQNDILKTFLTEQALQKY